MDNPAEYVCCRNTPCVTTDICLNCHVLSVDIINHSDFFGEDPEFTPINYTRMGTWDPFIHSVKGQKQLPCNSLGFKEY